MILLTFRAKIVLGYLRTPVVNALGWLFESREITNFTYDLDETNRRYLICTIADVVGVEPSVIERYVQEIEQNEELKRHVATATAGSDRGFMADPVVRFGRRIGWYAFARAVKPRIIVETGVDKGLGACLLTAALQKNAAEGFSGRYYGTDIDPAAGYLLRGEYAEFGRILYGDSIRSLSALEGEVDLFINDSDHSADYEYQEYLTIGDKLSDRAIILGDNAHCTDRLLQFSLATGRHFLFFQEKPAKHWYPGGGIGMSFKRSPPAR